MSEQKTLFDELRRLFKDETENKLTEEERKRIGKKPTENLQAYDYYLRGKSYFRAPKYWLQKIIR